MTRRIKLSYGGENSSTAISNIFIDEYMPTAHGSYVKVYIYLLRCLGDPSMSVSVADISDRLDETEKDIIKALKYWEKRRLLSLSWDEEGLINGISVLPLGYQVAGDDEDDADNTRPKKTDSARTDSVTVVKQIYKVGSTASAPVQSAGPADSPAPAAVQKDAPIARPSYTAKQLSQFREYSDFDALVDYIEQLTGCTVTARTLQTPAFLYESLGMSSELIMYLYDYCVSHGKSSGSYIEKAAIAWAEEGIDSVEKARAHLFSRSEECMTVCRTFGIRRSLGEPEYAFIERWTRQYGMTAELIKEACSRTLLKTGKPSFEYADSILSNWSRDSLKTLEDVAGQDRMHADDVRRNLSGETSTRRVQSSGSRTSSKGTASTAGKFAQFPQREHTDADYSDFEKKKLGLM